MAVLFILIDRMPFLAPIIDNYDTLFTLVIIPGIYVHHVEVAGQETQDPANGSLYMHTYLILRAEVGLPDAV